MTTTTLPVHTYTPRGAATDLFAYRGPEVLISGPAGTGKSRAALEKLSVMALQNPGMRGLIVRKTQVSLTASGLVTWKTWVIPELIESGGVEYYGGSREESAQYRYDNGSRIVIGGMDKASKIMSTEFDVIFVQEATELTVEDWETLTTRLRNGVVSFQQLIGDANPAEDTHWLKKRCDKGATKMLWSRHEDNPILFSEDDELTERGTDYLENLDRLTGVRYLRLRKGEWSSAEGTIYEEWESAVHLIDPFPIPDEWPRYWSVDFGFTNPFVCQFWARDDDGRLYLYREIYQTRGLVSEHAAAIQRLTSNPKTGKWTEPRPRAIVCDHDAEGRAQLVKALGMGTVTARKAVQDGIQAVKQRLKPADDGKPRLFVMRDSLVERDPELVETSRPCGLAEEIPAYVWASARAGAPKEDPVKDNDHSMDAMRYIVAHLDPIGQTLPSIRYL